MSKVQCDGFEFQAVSIRFAMMMMNGHEMDMTDGT